MTNTITKIKKTLNGMTGTARQDTSPGKYCATCLPVHLPEAWQAGKGRKDVAAY